MQVRKLVNKVNEQGKLTSMYVRGEPKTAYSIPFTKAEVDKYLKGEHPFGPDSINITDPDNVVFYGKFEHVDSGTMPFRSNTYSYEQFVTPEWRQFAELACRPGGPIGITWKHNNNNATQSHIT